MQGMHKVIGNLVTEGPMLLERGQLVVETNKCKVPQPKMRLWDPTCAGAISHATWSRKVKTALVASKHELPCKFAKGPAWEGAARRKVIGGKRPEVQLLQAIADGCCGSCSNRKGNKAVKRDGENKGIEACREPGATF